jgi:ABC-type sulfate transport system permease component
MEGHEEMSFRYTMIGAAVGIFIFYLGLILSLFYFVGGKGFWEALLSPSTLFSIRLSLIAATLATFFAVLIGFHQLMLYLVSSLWEKESWTHF